MKYFLIGLAIYFAIAWLPQYIRAWILDARYAKAKRMATPSEQWIYKD